MNGAKTKKLFKSLIKSSKSQIIKRNQSVYADFIVISNLNMYMHRMQGLNQEILTFLPMLLIYKKYLFVPMYISEDILFRQGAFISALAKYNHETTLV